ncbi:hypothetical protein PDL71_18095 [Lacibacter sp. MH-610]|uniref:hypothetical protein n=1 Tax=Lacibacter sp. MH-610 TaxID=3020883 RepID=UPI0038926C05
MEKRVKKTYICKGVKNYSVDYKKALTHLPFAGDVALFEVLTIGKHTQVQSEQIRNVKIIPGDVIMAAFGTRYATEQFEGYLPSEIADEYHILGAGGTVGILHSSHKKFEKTGPTVLRLIGYAVDGNNNIINTKKMCAHEMLAFSGAGSSLTKVILSIGSSMDSGKTTTAAHLVNGFKNTRYKTAFIKLTGTVFTKDKDLAYDMGADMVADFGDVGFPSTYMCREEELLNLYETLLAKVSVCSPDYVVIEIADGIFQRETAMLLTNHKFMAGIDAVIFSAGDSLSAVQGIKTLQDMHINATALSGLFTASPLLMREVKERVSLPIFTIEQLSEGAAMNVLGRSIYKTA